MTREQAIAEHRKMWNWIADETLKRQQKVNKVDYLYNLKKQFCSEGKCIGDCGICNEYLLEKCKPKSQCYCCEYARKHIKTEDQFYLCNRCPIQWKNVYGENCKGCCANRGLFKEWDSLTNYKVAAELARMIAELPEKE